jgi:hypothetical protein
VGRVGWMKLLIIRLLRHFVKQLPAGYWTTSVRSVLCVRMAEPEANVPVTVRVWVSQLQQNGAFGKFNQWISAVSRKPVTKTLRLEELQITSE